MGQRFDHDAVADAETLARAARRIGGWAEDPALAGALLALLSEKRVALDPPLLRAATSAGAEL
ncbi:MAG: hypothetical protein KF700_10460, partial [Hyphomonadaceae bacterium]|nr:hypothetical protein [Hyphomonadaceae bacterium]